MRITLHCFLSYNHFNFTHVIFTVQPPEFEHSTVELTFREKFYLGIDPWEDLILILEGALYVKLGIDMHTTILFVMFETCFLIFCRSHIEINIFFCEITFFWLYVLGSGFCWCHVITFSRLMPKMPLRRQMGMIYHTASFEIYTHKITIIPNKSHLRVVFCVIRCVISTMPPPPDEIFSSGHSKLSI